MVVIATAVATINSAASVSAVTASVVTVVALTVLAVTAAADSVVQQLALEQVDKVLCRRNGSIRGWQWNSIVVPSSTGPLSLLKVSQQRSLGPAYEHGQW